MKIAIVDDFENERKELKLGIQSYFDEKKDIMISSSEITEFENGEFFLDNFCPKSFTIIFLDIYMKTISGMDVARKIKEIDTDSQVVLFTNSQDHILEGYDVEAKGYLLKPVSENISSLYKILDRLLKTSDFAKKCIEVNTKYGRHQIQYQNIACIECNSRDVYMHLSNDTIVIDGKYEDYHNLLIKSPQFLECYRNILVNMEYIDLVLDNDFILKTGKKIPISRRKKNYVMEKYMEYFIDRKGR